MYDSVKSYSSWFCNWWLLACLPTVATEGRPGSKGLFDTICMIHWYTKDHGRELCHLQLPSVYMSYMISNIQWWLVGDHPREYQLKGPFGLASCLEVKPSICTAIKPLADYARKKLSKNRKFGFQHLKRSYRSAICHLRFYHLTSFDQRNLTNSGVQSLNLSLIL